MKKLIILLAITIVPVVCSAQNFNRPVPTGLPNYEFQRFDTTNLGRYYLCAPYLHNGGSGSYKAMTLMDEDGYIVWWTAGDKRFFDFKYHSNRNVFSYTKRSNGVFKHYVLDTDFNPIDSITAPRDVGDIHEFEIFPNGNYCFLGLNDTLLDLSGYILDGAPGSPNTNLLDLVVWEFDSLHNLVMRWSSIDHVPPDAFIDGYPYNTSNFDYVHGNSVEYDFDGNLIISLRTANAVYKIDHGTGNIIWRLGGDYSDFTFVNDSGFIGQHDARRLPNGNITIFDNQWNSSTLGSRGVEYSLNPSDSTATMVSEYTYSWPVTGPSLGSYRMLENGYQIIGWGNTRRPEPSFTLVDSNQNIAADFFFSDTVVTYRAFFQELGFTLNQPVIDCWNDGSTLTLTAPNGYSNYLWSTGEGTQSIVVSDTGTYVVWVDQGIGMLGSQPYYISDIGSHCYMVGLNETTDPEKPPVESLGYFDLLGRRIITPPPGALYLELFSDGTYIKRINLGPN